MRHLFHLSLLFLFLLALSCAPKETKTEKIDPINNPPEGFEMLFNGENFDGWHITTEDKEAKKNQFSVVDGMIHAYKEHENNSTQTFASLITNKEYENFILTLEYKWGEKKFKPRHEYVRDAGVLYHVWKEDVFWPYGAECQIQEGDTGDIWLIGTRGTSKVRQANRNYGPDGEPTTRGGENTYDSFARNSYWGKAGWNKIELVVKGDHATYKVNGKLVNEVFDLEKYQR